MIAGQITWEHFITRNNDAHGVRYKFENLCRQLFTYEFLSQNNVRKYVHSNPNNPGIESEPILDEVNNRYICYQAKYQRKKQLNIIKGNWIFFTYFAIRHSQLLVMVIRVLKNC